MASKKKAVKEKPLEKMTAKELRELAKSVPDITGASGMNKSELISEIKRSRGIEEDAPKKGGSAREIKQTIKALKIEQEKALEAEDEKMAAIYQKKIIRLKKKSRRLAA